jgi:hypothetical protein
MTPYFFRWTKLEYSAILWGKIPHRGHEGLFADFPPDSRKAPFQENGQVAQKSRLKSRLRAVSAQLPIVILANGEIAP